MTTRIPPAPASRPNHQQFPPAAALAAALTQDRQAVEEALAAAASPNTLRAYQSQLRQWQRFCQALNASPCPADPELLVLYLGRLHNQGKKTATLRAVLAALAWQHRRLEFPPPGEHPGIKTAMAGFSRQEARQRAPKQAPAFHQLDLLKIRATALLPRLKPGGQPESPAQARRRGLADIALAAAMRDGLLRISEAASLLWPDLTAEPEGHALLNISRSKTDQEGEGADLYLNPEALQDLLNWQQEQQSRQPGQERIFPWTPRHLVNRIKAAAQAAGIAKPLSGHSFRVGMAQDLAAAGAQLPELMQAGRWKSSQMPARYIRRQNAAQGAVAKYYRQSNGY